jgi:hypothetical protein
MTSLTYLDCSHNGKRLATDGTLRYSAILAEEGYTREFYDRWHFRLPAAGMGMASLRLLDCTSCRMQQLPEGLLRGLTRLQTLNLQGNQLKDSVIHANAPRAWQEASTPARAQRTKNKKQRTEHKEQRTEHKEQRTENREQRTEHATTIMTTIMQAFSPVALWLEHTLHQAVV